jgi:quinol monooxygenase YgiN
MLFAKLKVKEDKVAKYLEIADKTDKAVEVYEPGILHHTFDQDSVHPLCFVWSEVYKNDDALMAHLTNPALGVYLEAHAGLCDGALTVEIYGTVGEKVIDAINETGAYTR